MESQAENPAPLEVQLDFEDAVKQLCKYLKKGKNKKGHDKAPAVVRKIVEMLELYEQKRWRVDDNVLVELVETMESDGDDFCSEMDEEVFCAVLKILLQSNPWIQMQRGIFLLTRDSAESQKEDSITLRKEVIAKECLNRLLDYFTDFDRGELDLLARRRAGILCVELFKHTTDITSIASFCTTSALQSIGKMIFNDLDDFCRIIGGDLALILCEGGMVPSDIWPSEYIGKLQKFPKISAGQLDWAGVFTDWIVKLWNEDPDLVPDQNGDLFPCRSMSLYPELPFALPDHTLFVYVDDDVMSILAPSHGKDISHLIDIPMSCFKTALSNADDSSQLQEMQITLQIDLQNPARKLLDALSIELETISIILDLATGVQMMSAFTTRFPNLGMERDTTEINLNMPNSSRSLMVAQVEIHANGNLKENTTQEAENKIMSLAFEEIEVHGNPVKVNGKGFDNPSFESNLDSEDKGSSPNSWSELEAESSLHAESNKEDKTNGRIATKIPQASHTDRSSQDMAINIDKEADLDLYVNSLVKNGKNLLANQAIGFGARSVASESVSKPIEKDIAPKQSRHNVRNLHELDAEDTLSGLSARLIPSIGKKNNKTNTVRNSVPVNQVKAKPAIQAKITIQADAKRKDIIEPRKEQKDSTVGIIGGQIKGIKSKVRGSKSLDPKEAKGQHQPVVRPNIGKIDQGERSQAPQRKKYSIENSGETSPKEYSMSVSAGAFEIPEDDEEDTDEKPTNKSPIKRAKVGPSSVKSSKTKTPASQSKATGSKVVKKRSPPGATQASSAPPRESQRAAAAKAHQKIKTIAKRDEEDADEFQDVAESGRQERTAPNPQSHLRAKLSGKLSLADENSGSNAPKKLAGNVSDPMTEKALTEVDRGIEDTVVPAIAVSAVTTVAKNAEVFATKLHSALQHALTNDEDELEADRLTNTGKYGDAIDIEHVELDRGGQVTTSPSIPSPITMALDSPDVLDLNYGNENTGSTAVLNKALDDHHTLVDHGQSTDLGSTKANKSNQHKMSTVVPTKANSHDTHKSESGQELLGIGASHVQVPPAMIERSNEQRNWFVLGATREISSSTDDKKVADTQSRERKHKRPALADGSSISKRRRIGDEMVGADPEEIPRTPNGGTDITMGHLERNSEIPIDSIKASSSKLDDPSSKKDPSRKPKLIKFDKNGAINQGVPSAVKNDEDHNLASIDTQEKFDKKRKRDLQAGVDLGPQKASNKKRQYSSPDQAEYVDDDDDVAFILQDVSPNRFGNIIASPMIQAPKIGKPPVLHSRGKDSEHQSNLLPGKIFAPGKGDRSETEKVSVPSHEKHVRIKGIRLGRQNSQSSRVDPNGSPIALGRGNLMEITTGRLGTLEGSHPTLDKEDNTENDREHDELRMTSANANTQSRPRRKLLDSSLEEEVTSRYVAHEKTAPGKYKNILSQQELITEDAPVDPFLKLTYVPTPFTDRLRRTKLREEKTGKQEHQSHGNIPVTSNDKGVQIQAPKQSLRTKQKVEENRPGKLRASPFKLRKASSSGSPSSERSRESDDETRMEEWNIAIRPHYKTTHDVMHRIANEVILRLGDEEDRIEQIVKQYKENSSKIIDDLENGRDEKRSKIAHGFKSKSSLGKNCYVEARNNIQRWGHEIKENSTDGLEKEWMNGEDVMREMIMRTSELLKL